MDIFSHGLWAALAAKAANKKLKKFNDKPLNARRFVFWGLFPDLLAFTMPFAWLFIGLISGTFLLSDLPPPETIEPARPDTLWVFRLTSLLYNASHSLFVFSAVFGFLFLILRRPVWETGGWLLHIIIDIPTHSYKFYPTPFLWPLSDWKFDGFSWAAPWFLAINYLAIVVVFLILRKKTPSRS